MSNEEQTRQGIAIDPEVTGRDDNDAGDDAESTFSSTASATSSIYEYRKIQGRTYQNSNTTDYWHEWLTMMLDDKFDMADKFPCAEVIGVDISPTQPSWTPPNVKFQIDDAQLDWTFEPASFDFIHVRYMHGAFDNWPKLYRQMFKFLKPGGWFQHIEPNIHLKCENPKSVAENELVLLANVTKRRTDGAVRTFKQWAELFFDAGDKIGRTFRVTDGIMEESAREAGFEDIVHKIITIPLSGWPKEERLKKEGQFVGLYMDLSLDGFALYPIGQILGWSREKVDDIVSKMRAIIRNPKHLGSGDMHMVYGRKPLKADE
ncbi:hypothetical protein CDV31_010398 [Fusarium ambrosium]|uniref:Methyltransferase type 11 domain-containing protein n=1 Tax=Fusarium ambrosium TaxID=131363 RepID=A0A428TNK6_9HYPO|nr:hypothetical protein CDV31_010398 [Fusarium ambrosium]